MGGGLEGIRDKKNIVTSEAIERTLSVIIVFCLGRLNVELSSFRGEPFPLPSLAANCCLRSCALEPQNSLLSTAAGKGEIEEKKEFPPTLSGASFKVS